LECLLEDVSHRKEGDGDVGRDVGLCLPRDSIKELQNVAASTKLIRGKVGA
jgi:hypothetical protein